MVNVSKLCAPVHHLPHVHYVTESASVHTTVIQANSHNSSTRATPQERLC